MQKNKDIQLCKRRFIDLANMSYYKQYATFSDFLALNEQAAFHEIERELPPVFWLMWGGNTLSERKMIGFFSEEVTREQFPIAVIKIRAAHVKFAEKLTHRDYLGAVLNLGIDRCKIGDILLVDDEAFLFIEQSMEEYICSSLEKVKHTNVFCSKVSTNVTFEQKYKEIRGTVQSVRLDSVISTAFKSSRSQLISMISSGRVFVNGSLITNNSFRLKEGDIVSVRGMGKFLYEKEQDVTKKGKIRILLRKYV